MNAVAQRTTYGQSPLGSAGVFGTARPSSDPFNGLSQAPYQPSSQPLKAASLGAPPAPPGLSTTSPFQALISAAASPETARPGKESNATVQYGRIMAMDEGLSPHDPMYEELSANTVVFAGGDPQDGMWQHQNTLVNVRGLRWINQKLAGEKIELPDAMNLDLCFRDDVQNAQKYSGRFAGGNDTNPTYGLDISQGTGRTNRSDGDVAARRNTRSIADALVDTDTKNRLANPAYVNRYDSLVGILSRWRLDGVVINSDTQFLESNRQGKNDLLFNIAVAGNAQVRNVNTTVFMGGTTGVAGGTPYASRALPQEFDPLPNPGDEFYVALHLVPRGSGASRWMVLEYRLWSTRRWANIAARFAARAGTKANQMLSRQAKLTAGATPREHEPGRPPTRSTMRADELLEAQLFATIVGAWRVGSVTDSRAVAVTTSDPYYSLAGGGKRCAAVRALIGIRWEGLVALRQRHGTNCLVGDSTFSGTSVIIKTLDPTRLECYPIDIGEVYATTGQFTEYADTTTGEAMTPIDMRILQDAFQAQIAAFAEQLRVWGLKRSQWMRAVTRAKLDNATLPPAPVKPVAPPALVAAKAALAAEKGRTMSTTLFDDVDERLQRRSLLLSNQSLETALASTIPAVVEGMKDVVVALEVGDNGFFLNFTGLNIDEPATWLTEFYDTVKDAADKLTAGTDMYVSRHNAFTSDANETYLFLVDPSDCNPDGHTNFLWVKESVSTMLDDRTAAIDTISRANVRLINGLNRVRRNGLPTDTSVGGAGSAFATLLRIVDETDLPGALPRTNSDRTPSGEDWKYGDVPEMVAQFTQGQQTPMHDVVTAFIPEHVAVFQNPQFRAPWTIDNLWVDMRSLDLAGTDLVNVPLLSRLWRQYTDSVVNVATLTDELERRHNDLVNFADLTDGAYTAALTGTNGLVERWTSFRDTAVAIGVEVSGFSSAFTIPGNLFFYSVHTTTGITIRRIQEELQQALVFPATTTITAGDGLRLAANILTGLGSSAASMRWPALDSILWISSDAYPTVFSTFLQIVQYGIAHWTRSLIKTKMNFLDTADGPQRAVDLFHGTAMNYFTYAEPTTATTIGEAVTNDVQAVTQLLLSESFLTTLTGGGGGATSAIYASCGATSCATSCATACATSASGGAEAPLTDPSATCTSATPCATPSSAAGGACAPSPASPASVPSAAPHPEPVDSQPTIVVPANVLPARLPTLAPTLAPPPRTTPPVAAQPQPMGPPPVRPAGSGVGGVAAAARQTLTEFMGASGLLGSLVGGSSAAGPDDEADPDLLMADADDTDAGSAFGTSMPSVPAVTLPPATRVVGTGSDSGNSSGSGAGASSSRGATPLRDRPPATKPGGAKPARGRRPKAD
jgi:hypothetical protein